MAARVISSSCFYDKLYSWCLQHPGRLLAWTILSSTLARLVMAGLLGSSYDEDYYVALARHISLSYFDHPPLLMWYVAAAMKLTGSGSIFILRAPLIVLSAGTTLMMYRLTSIVFDRQAGAFAALLLNLSLLFGLFAGGWVIPEGPLMFCLLCAAICVARVVICNSRHPMLYWLLAGMWFGLAMLSKYSAFMVMGGFGIFLLASREGRRSLAHPGPYLAVLVSALVFTPAVIWNSQHDWASFAFQGHRVVGDKGIRVIDFFKSVFFQAGVISPWIWGPLVYDFVVALRAGPSRPRSWFFCSAASFPIILFSTFALWVHSAVSHVHWSAPGYLFLFPLLGRHTAVNLENGVALTRRWLALSTVVTLLLLIIIASHVSTGWITRLTATPPWRDPTAALTDWAELKSALERQGLLENRRLFIAGTHRYDTSKLDLEFGSRLPVIYLGKNPTHYRYMFNLHDFDGWDAVIAGRRLSLKKIQADYGCYFGSIIQLDDVIIYRAGQAVLTIGVFLGKDYHSP
jgi:hypothetical protein